MDNLAHTLIGIGVARCGLSRRFGEGTTVTLALASNLPDLDIVWTIFDPWDRFMLRRTHTHAIVALPLLAALLAFALRRRYREQPWSVLFGLSALGIALHLLFDLVNSFGVVLLWPFTLRRFELASVFIIDLCIWGLMLAPIAAGRWLKTEAASLKAYRGAVAALGLYVILCLAAHARAESAIRGELAARNLRADAIRVFPEPLGPGRFRAAVLTGESWEVYLCSVPGGSCERRAGVPTTPSAPRVAEVRASPRGRALERFMAAPVWTLRPDGGVEVYDLRFVSLIVPRGKTFRVEFPPGRLEPVVR
ncbi:MAG: metal-dependent hydrolase [Planctomycetes bacterium]|nr:metal-dependent hydrolase [Planctomycetota bacterium]